MTIIKPLLISFSLLAFSSASALANEEAKRQPSASGASSPSGTSAEVKSFAELDTNNDGSLGRMEAAADADAKSRFEKLDRNRDQKLSRSEYESAQQQSSSAKGQSAAAGASQGKSGQQGAKATGQVSAEQLIGKKVSDAQGEEIGEIKDVVVDLRNGRVHAAVLEFGGMLGVGEKNYAFPINQLKPGKGRGQYTMNIDKRKLENAQGFAQNEWPAMDSEYWGKIGGQGKAAAGATKAGKMTLVRASEVQGKPVSDKSGQQVGEVQDLVIDMKSGQLRSIIIDVSGGGQARVQPKALSAGMDDKLVLNMDAKQLKRQAQKSGKSRTQGSAAGGASGEQQQPAGSGK